MATSGVFNLITNTGKQDKMLMASELLRKRINKIKANKVEPTLKDLEQTHILFFSPKFKPFVALSLEYNKVATTGGNKIKLGSNVRFSIPQFGDLISDMVVHVKMTAPTITSTDPITPSARWCDFIGERLFEKVSFSINGNPLDEYDHHAMNFKRLFLVPSNLKESWYRCMGQQLPEEAYLNQLSGIQNATPDNYQIALDVYMGYQTPKETPDSVELFVPLNFWFNNDPKLALPSIAIPHGQRFIDISLASQSEIFTTLLRGGSATPTVSDITFTEFALYVNNIFLNPEVHDIFLKRIGFTLIRVHKMQTYNATKSDDQVLLKDMKFPIEALFIGMKLTSNASDMNNWHSFCKISTTEKNLPNVLAYYESNGDPLDAFVDIQRPQITVHQKIATISNISLTAHGVKIYDNFPTGFFNAYTPYKYGGQNFGAPDTDLGALFIPFCLYPGTYQPSGHINVSRAREFYLNYLSAVDSGTSVITSGTPGTLIILASALNFLLISDGSCVLRYAT